VKVQKIERGIYFIEGENRGKFPYCNCLLVDDVLIDAGAGTTVVGELEKKAKKLVLSHNHPDHSSGSWIFNKKHKKVFSPEGFDTSLDSLALRFVGKELAEIWKFFIVSTTGMKSFQSEKYGDGEILNKEPEIESIKLPGHTMDMHVFLIDGRILYGADIDLTGFGPWYGNPESDPELFRKSIEDVKKIDFEIFISSHRNPVKRDEAERLIDRYIQVFDDRERKILEILDGSKGKTVEEIVEISPFYGKKPYAKEILDFFERNMIIKHLEILRRKGEIKETDGRFCRAKN
jgi:glyoxylase-like metal-dependent hydrolase (beta-lactamase superfamily II)